jgi:methylmalonyl-CoA/ethylmalonyl-CoA epimerase
LKLNHIGMVVDNISEFAKLFEVLGLKEITDPEPDSIQKVLACFITAGEGQKIHIELLEPTDESSPISNFLKKRGGGLHHLCFEVDDIEEVMDELVRKGFRMVSAPVNCVGYEKSFGLKGITRIAFFLLSDRILIELLEKGQT